MPPKPKKRLVVVTCMDARIDVHRMLGLEQGDAHVLRNAGGVVTDDVIRSITISQKLLGTNEVIVVMHTDCGLQGLAEAWAQGFMDLEQALREGVERLRICPELRHRDRIRGFVYDPDAGALREVA